MGAQVQLFFPNTSSDHCQSYHHAGDEEGHEGYEGHEGDEGWWSDDPDRCVPVGGRDHRLENEGSEGCCGCTDGRRRGAGEEAQGHALKRWEVWVSSLLQVGTDINGA